jgi:sec-independent protein translocase protein TatB
MFDIGWSELVVVGVVALIAIGPKELPGVLRMVGQWMGKVRRMASEFQGQFQEAMREAEMADLKKQVDDIASTASSYTQFDPVESIRKEFDGKPEDKAEDKPTPPAEAAPVEPVVAAGIPAPVGQDFTIPQPAPPPAADAAGPSAAGSNVSVAAEAPQPVPAEKPAAKAGEGA